MENIINFLVSNMEWIFIICLTISEFVIWFCISAIINKFNNLNKNDDYEDEE